MFRERLKQEFEARREKNARFSLRAFARFLGADHATLSQILRGARPVPSSHIRSWGKKVGLSAEEISACIAAQHVRSEASLRREEQLRHWTAEAMSVTSEPVHWNILRLCRTSGFRPDCRWIAAETGATVDQVNIALARLLRLGLIEMDAGGRWLDRTRLRTLTENSFRKLALARVREKAGKAWGIR